MSKKSKPETADLNAFAVEAAAESSKGTPRGYIMVNCSYIDLLLRDLIRDRLVKHKASDKLLGDENEGPLSRFSARIDVALAIGIIEICEHTALHILRGIRNECAHKIEFNIELQSVKNKIRSASEILDRKTLENEKLNTKDQLIRLFFMIIGRLSKRSNDRQVNRLPAYELIKYHHKDMEKPLYENSITETRSPSAS